MSRPKSDFSKTNRLTLRLSNNDLVNLNSIKNTGAFDNESDTLRFCITFTNIILNMIPAAVVESFIVTAEDSLNTLESSNQHTAHTVPETERLPSPADDYAGPEVSGYCSDEQLGRTGGK